jgi:hypothetical protein
VPPLQHRVRLACSVQGFSRSQLHDSVQAGVGPLDPLQVCPDNLF